MYAIIKTGGKQYRVEESGEIQIEKLPDMDVGDSVTFDRVLMVSDQEGLDVGRPYLENAQVEGNIVESDKQDKITVYKYKKRKGYRKKKGHRQPYMKVRIESIQN